MAVARNVHYPGVPGTKLYGGITPPPAGALVTTFDLDEWSGLGSRTLFRGGMLFKKGDVPAGSALQIRRGGNPVAAQFDERTTWSDGSLRFTVCHLRDSDFGASETREYEVWTVPDTAFDNVGATSLSSVASANNFTVEISSFTQSDGGAPTTRGSGAALATFAAHASVATRVTKIHSGPVCEGWEVWGMFNDGLDGSGSPDAHLKAIWYVDVWKDGSGAVIDTEFAPVLAQDWWAVADKRRLGYTATLKRNGSTVQTYSGVTHPYHSRWAMMRMQSDHNHGRRHWVGDVPTLTYLLNQEYWKQTNCVPGYDTSVETGAGAAITLVPLSSQEHKADLDGTGGYIGRGLFPVPDAKAFIRRTPVDFRNMRVNAFAGLHVNKHFRDERTRTREGESADIANTLVPLIWLPKAESASTFAGLPTPKHASRTANAALPNSQGGYVAVTGGLGVWTNTIDASHAVAYSLFAYLVEGERYFLEASIDLATYNAQCSQPSSSGSYPPLHWYGNTNARAEMSIPSTRWSAIPDFIGQQRSLGWSANNLAVAGFVPDNDPQGQYLRAWNSHCAEYLSQCVAYTPPSLRSAGVTHMASSGSQGAVRAPWQAGFIVQGCSFNYLVNEHEGFKEYANLVARAVVALPIRNKYDMLLYRYMQSAVVELYNSGNYRAANQYLHGPLNVTVSSDAISAGESQLPSTIANGDLFYFVTLNEGVQSAALPSGYTEGTPLYAVESSGHPFKAATSPGGTPIAIPNGSYSIAGQFTGRAGIAVAAFPPYLPDGDSYPMIIEATMAMAERAGLDSVPAGTAAACRAHLANVNRGAGRGPAWALLAPEVEP